MPFTFTSAAFLADPTKPGTHALIVGIGRYPYLTGGGSQAEGAGFPLRQLTSSPKSAHTVCDWLLAQGEYAGKPNAGLNNPSAPLATVELLIAGDPPAAVTDEPTVDRLTQAIEDWKTRCDAHVDNVAFLYLCGHGLKLGDLVLLASDFGRAGVNNAWHTALSLDSIRLGMRKCRAPRQFLFFDCCRSYLASVNAGNERGIQIFDNLLNFADTRSYVAMYSTLEGSPAFGVPDEPSYFTKALLDALMGFGAERRGGGWQVTNRMINKALHEIMRFDVKSTANLQLVTGEAPGDAVLHVLTSDPRVKTRVQCEPVDRMPEVAFSLHRAAEHFDHAGVSGPFRMDIAPGEWQIDLKRNGNPAPVQQDFPVITPPAFDKVFQLE